MLYTAIYGRNQNNGIFIYILMGATKNYTDVCRYIHTVYYKIYHTKEEKNQNDQYGNE